MDNNINHKSIKSSGLTHPGKVREHNEDSLLQLNNEGLWVVADGAGGHEHGEVASQMIVQQLSHFKKQESIQSDVSSIISILNIVNADLIKMRADLPTQGLIGSTVCILLLDKCHVICIWSGDSRIYLFRNSQLFCLTQDHNRIDEFLHAGFPESEIHKYPAAHQLTNAVGANDHLRLGVLIYEYINNDIFMLCSDGLSGELSRNDIIRTLQTNNNIDSLNQALLALVLQGRARDNATSILIKISE